jgi:anti-sigma factor RsiW
MMGNIIRLPEDRRHEIQLLLPWYVTGRLDAVDRARVEAHLSLCPECQSELASERRLAEEVAALPVDVEHAWASVLAKVQNPAHGRGFAVGAWISWLGRRAGGLLREGGPWMGWAAVAGLALVLAIGAPGLRSPHPASYHALSAAPARPVGDMIVIFRPEANERAIRQALREAGARVTDGPTEADAYVLETPEGGRAHALKILRARRAVVVAEPIDGGDSP